MNSRVESRFIAYSGRIAWSLCLISLVFALLALLLLATSVNVDVGSAWSGRGALLFFIVFSIVGGLIVAHQPRQMIGWIFCWTGLINEFMGFAKEYAIYTLLARPNLFPGGVIMAWLRDWLWIPGTVAPIIFVPLLFPTGHLPARGWRPMVWVTMIALSLSAFAVALKPGKLGEFSFVDNPFGINGTGEISEFILLAGLLISIGTLVGAVLSLLLRLRNSAGQERKQLQWLVFAALLLPPAFFVGIIFPTIGAPVLLGAIQILPISVGIAILRYRLWDIDIIIRRT
ncbi:MAG: hypothetical protein HY070_09655, partial [Chloroflexi bacterium]|nr:hypothetical protein [Chloroflexota bacterium]